MSRWHRLCAFVLLVLSQLACDVLENINFPSPGEPHPPAIVVRLVISPLRPTLRVGEEILLTVAAESEPPGEPIQMGVVTWTIDKPEIASVESPVGPCGDRCALLAGHQPGGATVHAAATLDGQAAGVSKVVTVLSSG